jgi:hypothetical protein
VLTGKWLKSADIIVPKSQVEAYREHNANRIVSIPDKLNGNIARKRNAVLDLYPGDWVTMLDDDIKWVGYHEEGIRIKADEDYFLDFCQNMFVMAEEMGSLIWGVNVSSDEKFYREYSPFSLSSVILGPFLNVINDDEELRFDEKIAPKEDYDYFLKVINKYRRVLRNNKWFYEAEHIMNKGGIAGQRNAKKEIRLLDMLVKRWGNKIVQTNRVTHMGNKTINAIIRVPIKGI